MNTKELIQAIERNKATNEMVAVYRGLKWKSGRGSRRYYEPGKAGYFLLPNWLGNTDDARTIIDEGVELVLTVNADGAHAVLRDPSLTTINFGIADHKIPASAITIAALKAGESDAP